MVREAKSSDFESIAKLVDIRIQNAAQPKAQFNWGPQKITEELKQSKTLVVDNDQEIKAFLSYRELPDFFEITVLATDLRFQQTGLQTELMRALQEKSGLLRKPILLEVHESNASAISFYRKMKFRKISERKCYYSDGKTAFVFEYFEHDKQR